MDSNTSQSMDIDHAKKFLAELIDKGVVTLRILSERTGYSRATWSQYRDNKYNGDVGKVDQKLVEFIKNWMKRDLLADTSTTKILKSACADAFEWKRLGIIMGPSGVGKTATIKALEQERP